MGDLAFEALKLALPLDIFCFFYFMFPFTFLYVYVQNERKDELSFTGPLIQDLLSCSQRRKANTLSHFNT